MATFFQVVTDALNDIAEHGYESEERLQYWIDLIREAAITDMVSERSLAEELRKVLGSTYTRLIDEGTVLRRHPGVDRFTVQRIAPKLRAELNRRIQASADLIKLNREQAINDTLRRFQGWATSVPIGGTDQLDRREQKREIRKGLTSLPFVERRVIIDQGHKLNASVSAILAEDAGAIAARWRSHWRQSGYDYREDHKERDQQVYAIRNSWAHTRGFMRAGDAGFSDKITQPGEEIFCLPGDTRLPFADGVEVAYRRWYSGQLTELITDTGKTLRATPNHPILTPCGWRPIQSLNNGDHVIEATGEVAGTESDDNDAIPSIEQIYSSLVKFGFSETRRGQRQQFHGDGTDSDIDIVWTYRPLYVGAQVLSSKSGNKFGLSVPDYLGLTSCSTQQFGARSLFASSSLMSSLGVSTMLVGRLISSDEDICLSLGTRLSAGLLNMTFDRQTRYAKPIGYREHTFTAVMGGADSALVETNTRARGQLWPEIDPSIPVPLPEGRRLYVNGVSNFIDSLPFATKRSNVVHINNRPWSGHVYNLQTINNWYVAQGVVTHNCRCYYVYIYHLRDLPDDMLTARGRQALDTAREKLPA